MKVVGTFVLLAILVGFASHRTVHGQVRLQPVVTGLSRPVLITHAGDRRLFIVEQGGTVRIFYGGALLATSFLNVTTLATSSGERGLLGLAFHPNYPKVPYLFVHFTSNGTPLPDGTAPAFGDNLVVRYMVSADRNVADPQSARVLMRIPQPFTNHNGGMIAFGPDGYLYIAKGDGGSGNDPGSRAQNIDELLGKILRIDVDGNINTPPYYSVPATNPFASGPGRDEVFLIGLRNPWRFSFDRASGDLWIGDVGQGAWEEIDHLPIDASAPGSNFGWRIYEGSTCTDLDPCTPPAKYVPPVFSYLSGGSTTQCSVTGGYVYRGMQTPAITGRYVYADYCTGEIFTLLNGAGSLLIDSEPQISSFGESWDGELYIAGHNTGSIYKLLPDPLPKAIVAGRITDARGRSVSARVTKTSLATGEQIRMTTNTFGYYRFTTNDLNQQYTISAYGRVPRTATVQRTITLTDDFYGIDLRLDD